YRQLAVRVRVWTPSRRDIPLRRGRCRGDRVGCPFAKVLSPAVPPFRFAPDGLLEDDTLGPYATHAPPKRRCVDDQLTRPESRGPNRRRRSNAGNGTAEEAASRSQGALWRSQEDQAWRAPPRAG